MVVGDIPCCFILSVFGNDLLQEAKCFPSATLRTDAAVDVSQTDEGGLIVPSLPVIPHK